MTVGIVQPSSHDAEVERLARKALALWKSKGRHERVLIAVCGIPGSGKTTLAARLARRLNAMLHRERVKEAAFAMAIPMDGYHLSRRQLAAMPDPATAIHRRGAAFTFDAQGLYELVRSLREQAVSNNNTTETEREKEEETKYAPGFDHATKDPVADEIAIPPESRVLVFEGLYLALDREPWRSTAALMDELWFVDIDREVARQRLVKRHVASGIVDGEEAAKHRVASTDFLNADDILQNRLPIHECVQLGQL